jgi:hypothetical protein
VVELLEQPNDSSGEMAPVGEVKAEQRDGSQKVRVAASGEPCASKFQDTSDKLLQPDDTSNSKIQQLKADWAIAKKLQDEFNSVPEPTLLSSTSSLASSSSSKASSSVPSSPADLEREMKKMRCGGSWRY